MKKSLTMGLIFKIFQGFTQENFENLECFCGKIATNGYLLSEKYLNMGTYIWKISPEHGYGSWGAGAHPDQCKSEFPPPPPLLHRGNKASYGISMTAHCKWTTKVFTSKSITFLIGQYIALISQTTLMISIMLFSMVWIWKLILDFTNNRLFTLRMLLQQ